MQLLDALGNLPAYRDLLAGLQARPDPSSVGGTGFAARSPPALGGAPAPGPGPADPADHQPRRPRPGAVRRAAILAGRAGCALLPRAEPLVL
jgi:hypothetical protein